MSNYLGMREMDLLRQILTTVESMNIDVKAQKEHIADIKSTMRDIKASVVRKYSTKE